MGIKHEVLIPIDYVLKDNQQPLDLAGVTSVFVCREVCIPVKLSVSFMSLLILLRAQKKLGRSAACIISFAAVFQPLYRVRMPKPDGHPGRLCTIFLGFSQGITQISFPKGWILRNGLPLVEVRDLVVRVWWPLASSSHQAGLPAEIQLTYRDLCKPLLFSAT